MNKFFSGRWFAMALVCILWTPTAAADSTSEILSLDLEDLLNMEISRREPLGIHHTHKRGEVMFNVSTIFMSMHGHNRQRTDALADFLVAPTEMDMQMFMVGGMYAPKDTVTLMAMVPYIEKSMHHVTRMGTRFDTHSRGLGDVKVSSLMTLWRGARGKLNVELGISVPTGDIDVEDMTPGGNSQLPYPMQLGSGTWDLLSGITFQGYRDQLSWGANIRLVTPTGRNDNHYRLGNRQRVVVWSSYLVNDWMSTHIRVDNQRWQSVSGADPALNPSVVPTAHPDLQGGRRIDLGIGFNGFVQSGLFANHRWSLELRVPVSQNLSRYQLEPHWGIHFGWNWILTGGSD